MPVNCSESRILEMKSLFRKLHRLLLPLAIFLGSSVLGHAQNTVVVSGDVKNVLGAAAPDARVKICLSLVDGSGAPVADPRIPGVGVLVQDKQICVSPTNGHWSTTVYGNDMISVNGVTGATMYNVVYLINGQYAHGDTFILNAADGTADLNSKAGINTAPVTLPPSPPVLDQTYARKDAGNMPFTGPISAPSIASSGPVTAGNLSVAGTVRDCRQDGTLDLTGVADAAAIINTCIVNALLNGQNTVLLPAGFLNIKSSPLNVSNAPAMTIQGGNQPCCELPTGVPTFGSVLLCNTGTQCIEGEGSSGLKLRNLTLALNGSIGGISISTPTKIGLITGRDNDSTGLAGGTSGGSGSANQYCFQENLVVDNVVIENYGSPNNSINSTNGAGNARGYVAWYNVGGAENSQVTNSTFKGGTPIVASTTDILAPTGTYHTLATGCPASLTRVNFSNTLFINDGSNSNGNPDVELNNFTGYDFVNADWIGGNAAYLLEGSGGNSMLTATGQAEAMNATSYFIEATTSLIGGEFHGTPAASAFFNPLANGLEFNELYVNFGEAPVALATNTATGTTFSNDHLHIGSGNFSLSNVTLGATDVYDPNMTTCGTLHSGSSFWLHAGTGGLLQCGGFLVSGGQLLGNEGGASTPGYGFNGDPTTGIWDNGGANLSFSLSGGVNTFIASGETRTGSGQVRSWSSNANPLAAGADTGICRGSAGTVDVSNGATCNANGNLAANNVVVGNHLNQNAAGDFACSCTMSSNTTCTCSISNSYTTPKCIAGAQSSTVVAGTCTATGTTVTINAASANSNAWSAFVFGAPN